MRGDCETMAVFLRDHRSVLVAAHRNPDGDAIGASAALAHLIRRAGGRAVIYNTSGVPADLAWVDLGAPLATRLDELGGFEPDAVVLVDCALPSRVGGDLAEALQAGRFPAVGVIDHHMGDAPLADVAWIEPQAAAASLMVGKLALAMGQPLDGALGEAVYLGLVSDTGSFSFSNTDAEALEMACAIVKAGLDVGAFTERREHVWTLSRLRLWGELVGRVRLDASGRIAGAAVPRALLERYGENARALEGFSSRMRTLQGVRVAILAREEEGGVSRASLRSGPGVDVRRLAAMFGGGGHEHAAGATLEGDAPGALSRLMDAAARMLEDAPGGASGA